MQLAVLYKSCLSYSFCGFLMRLLQDRWRYLLVWLLVVMLGLWVVLAWDTQPLRCPIKLITGIPCLGCGSLRSVRALLQGEFVLAFKLNPLALVSFPLIGLMLVSALVDVLCTSHIYDRFFRASLSSWLMLALGVCVFSLYFLKLYYGLA